MYTQDRHRWNRQAWESGHQWELLNSVPLYSVLFYSMPWQNSFSLEPSALYKHGQEGSSWRHYGTPASVPIVSASWSSVCSSWSSHSSPAFPLTISDVHNDYTQTHPRHTYTVTIPKHPWHTQLLASLGCCPQVGTFSSTNCFLLLPDQTGMQARWGERDPWIKHMTLGFFFLLYYWLTVWSLSPFHWPQLHSDDRSKSKGIPWSIFGSATYLFGTGPKAFLHPILTVLSFCKEAVQQEEWKRMPPFQPVGTMPLVCWVSFHFISGLCLVGWEQCF